MCHPLVFQYILVENYKFYKNILRFLTIDLLLQLILFLSGRQHFKSDEYKNRKIRHQRPGNHCSFNDLKTTEFSGVT